MTVKAPALVDTHCHLEMDRFSSDREEVIKRAFDSGLEALITIASDPASNGQALAIARAHDNVYCTVGLHPHDARFADAGILDMIRSMASEEEVVAIGETGLDYHYDNSPRDVQREAFEAQLAIASETGLPAVIHVREAEADAVRIISASGITRGVLHCFSGAPELQELARSTGLHMSIAGPVTFPKAEALRKAVRNVPDELLLLETDAPFLSPVPVRGKRNEPAYVLHTAIAVAELRGVSLEDVSRITTMNARRLFGIGPTREKGEIAYRIRDSLYLNLTNRCTNNCGFCARTGSYTVKGHNLKLEREPTPGELISAIGDPGAHEEVVFCGFGEPLIRLEEVKEVASWVKSRGGRVRVNTNGHASHIHGRPVSEELAGLVDEYSVSLDAQDAETYDRICRPSFEGAFGAVLDFIREAKKNAPSVRATVVTAEGVDIEKCRRLAGELGVGLRVRTLGLVG
jgi:TatD DNase family protein